MCENRHEILGGLLTLHLFLLNASPGELCSPWFRIILTIILEFLPLNILSLRRTSNFLVGCSIFLFPIRSPALDSAFSSSFWLLLCCARFGLPSSHSLSSLSVLFAFVTSHYPLAPTTAASATITGEDMGLWFPVLRERERERIL